MLAPIRPAGVAGDLPPEAPIEMPIQSFREPPRPGRRVVTTPDDMIERRILVVVATLALGMFAATAFCGAASGLGYRGSLQVVNEIAPADRRAEVLSAYFICCFTGNSVPVIGVGVITMQAGAPAASASFAALIVLFALAALALSRK